MNDTPFERFISLVQIDLKINALNQSNQALEKENQESMRIDESNHTVLEKVKHKLHDMRKEVDQKELEMKSLDLQEAEKKRRLEQVANHKEYQLLKAEIDQLKQAQHDLEEGLMAAWNQLENVKKEYDSALLDYEKQHKAAQEHIEENKKKSAQLHQEIQELTGQRVAQEAQVPAEWLDKYAIMRTKVTNPVVPVINGDCTACFYRASAQDMQFLRLRKLVQCKDCFRLLYLPQAQEASPSSEAL